MNVQENVVSYVQSHGIMQKFLVEKTGMHKAKVSMIMNNKQKMSVDDFSKFCITLQKQPNDFFDLEEIS